MDKKSNRMGLVRIAAFLLLFCILFVIASYRMRPTFYFTECYRELKEEEAPIDVLLIGGSSTEVYWSPMLAFDRYGISSFDFSDSAMSCALMKGLLEESKRFCQPKLYILDLRGFSIHERDPDVFTEGYFRTYTDAIPYSRNRTACIRYAAQFADFAYDPSSLYLDLFYYHGQWRELNAGNWLRQETKRVYKGQLIPMWQHNRVTLNAYSDVTQRAELSDTSLIILNDLIDYVKENNLPVLFLLNAYSFPDEMERSIYNTIFDILDERNMDYLDTNLYYQEMGLDGDTDFYNVNHVNAIGAEKYTCWVAEELIRRCDLENHREDPAFQAWREELPIFSREFENAKQHYWGQILAREGENSAQP